jgi:hypothetical protein
MHDDQGMRICKTTLTVSRRPWQTLVEVLGSSFYASDKLKQRPHVQRPALVELRMGIETRGMARKAQDEAHSIVEELTTSIVYISAWKCRQLFGGPGN